MKTVLKIFGWIVAVLVMIALGYFGWMQWGGRFTSSSSATRITYVLAPGFENAKELAINSTEEVMVEEGVPTQAYSAPNCPGRPNLRFPGTVCRMLFSNGEVRDYKNGDFCRGQLPSNIFKFVVFGGKGKLTITMCDPY